MLFGGNRDLGFASKSFLTLRAVFLLFVQYFAMNLSLSHFNDLETICNLLISEASHSDNDGRFNDIHDIDDMHVTNTDDMVSQLMGQTRWRHLWIVMFSITHPIIAQLLLRLVRSLAR